MTRRPGALVIGANYRALGIVRSLGRRGIEAWLLHEPGDDQVSRTSRYARRSLAAPQGDAAAQREALLELAARHGLKGWALFPTGDESVALLARARDALAEQFTFTSPEWDILRYAYDKRLTDRLARQAGVEYPWTRYPLGPDDLATLECEFPVVLKPTIKPRENSFTRAKAWRVDDRLSLMAAWDSATALVGRDAVMVQELIPGLGETQYSFAALCREGVPLATLLARRVRQYPRDFGHSSSLVETIDAPPLLDRGRAIVEALRWTGLVEVEFKYDARDGSYKLLDINGRVWTWHGLGPRAGVDFPYLAWRMSQGLEIEPVSARPGVRWVRLATDVPSALGALAAGELSLREWATSLRPPRVPAVLAWDDPLPALADPLLVAGRVLRRAGAERRRARRSARGA